MQYQLSSFKTFYFSILTYSSLRHPSGCHLGPDSQEECQSQGQDEAQGRGELTGTGPAQEQVHKQINIQKNTKTIHLMGKEPGGGKEDAWIHL